MSSDSIDVGTVIAETYEVTHLIGRGGMGAVWAASHRRLPGKRVAVKVLLGEGAANPASFARFRREAEIASRLGHPNIVEVLDFNTLENGIPYIILEYLQGESLADRIRKGPVNLETTMAIVRQVGSALAAAHKEGIVHRDLKPDNIYLCPSDVDGRERVKVLDFGISKIRDSNTVQTQANTLLGTPQYMSPEQASGKHAETDQRTDQFALAAIVYEMLCGAPAFTGESLAEVICKVMLEPPEPLTLRAPSVPPRVYNAVDKGLAKKPAERFADINAFVTELSGRPLLTVDRTPVPSAGSLDATAATGAAPETNKETPTPLPSLPPAVAHTMQPPPPPSAARTAIIATIAIGALVGIGGGAFFMMKKPPQHHEVAPAAETPPPPKPKMDPTPQPPERPVVESAAKPPALTAAPKKKVAEAAPEVESEALKEKLSEGEEALAAGNVGKALAAADRALVENKNSGRAYGLKARAYCARGDLGMAKAQKHRLGKEAAKVRAFCKAKGVDID